MIGALHALAYRDDPRTTLAAVVDADPERARAVGRGLDVSWYVDVDELLARVAFDVATIATREHDRLAPAVACARAGKHLLLEKPLTPTLAETDRLVAEIEATGVTAMVNYILRSDPRFLAAKRAMSEGVVGEPCTLFARRRGTSRGAEIYGPWTDLLISTAIHDLDAMVWLNDSSVHRVYAEGVLKRHVESGEEDAVGAVLRFENGAVGVLETSWVLPPSAPALLDTSFQVVGTRGGVFVDGSNHGLAIISSERYTLPDLAHWPSGQTGVEGSLRASIDNFVDCLARGRAPAMTLREARYAEAIVAALKRSMARGQPVDMTLADKW